MRWYSPTHLTLEGLRLGLRDQRHWTVVIEGARIVAVRLHGNTTDRSERAEQDSDKSWASSMLIDARQSFLLPALWDSHIHLSAWLRSRASTDVCEGEFDRRWFERAREDAMVRARDGGGRPWIVGFGWDHHHDTDRVMSSIDAVADPCLIVHRTGRAGLINSEGAGQLGAPGRRVGDDVGRYWRLALGRLDPIWQAEQLGKLRDVLVGQGVGVVTDATPYPSGSTHRQSFLRRHLAPVAIEFMRAPSSDAIGSSYVKYLSVWDIDSAAGNAALAIHAIEPVEILRALSAIRASGQPGRIEHAAICPPPVASMIRESDVLVSMNPGFRLARPHVAEAIKRQGLDAIWHPVWDVWGGQARCAVGSDAPVGDPGILQSAEALEARIEWPIHGPNDFWELLAFDTRWLTAPGETWLGADMPMVLASESTSWSGSPDYRGLRTMIFPTGEVAWLK